jgi:hypothetical protein
MALPVTATPSQSPFPNILFTEFSRAVTTTFGSSVTLATVLAILFSLTDNTDLLNLHFRQQHPTETGENKIHTSGWITALVNALSDKLGKKRTSSLFFDYEYSESLWENDGNKRRIKLIAGKLDSFANDLSLSPYDQDGNYCGKLGAISHDKIQPALVICPTSFVCATQSCSPRSLLQASRSRDIPLVTCVKGHTIHKNVPVLTGQCHSCQTSYSADHERFQDLSTISKPWKREYLNSAKYIKIGQALWVDRLFCASAVNAMYNFHASASAYAEYWNNTFGTGEVLIARAHIWQTFVQESMRTIAEESQINVELNDALDIKEVTAEAFSLLGENGIIRAADKHSCDECTQIYRRVGETSAQVPTTSDSDSSDSNVMDVDKKFVKMAVLDGIVMGPTHCAYDNCSNDLSNSRGGSLCDQHHLQLGSYCLVRDCSNRRVEGTCACSDHQSEWNTYKKHTTQNVRSGVRRMLQHPGENYEWQPKAKGPNPQRHDDPNTDPPLPSNLFSPSRFYCVETVCAPCGVVIAWTKFDRSESPTNILNFLESVFPTEESRPDYICIDKACQVLATAVANGSWESGHLEKDNSIHCRLLSLHKSSEKTLSLPQVLQPCSYKWPSSQSGYCRAE